MNDGFFGALPPFVSLRTGSALVAAAFAFAAAMCWVGAGYELSEVRLVNTAAQGESVERVERLRHEKAGTLLATVQVVSALLVVAAFLPWLHQARVNLRSFGIRGLRYARHWTYLGFLVPVLHFYRPLQVVSEVWRGSHAPGVDPTDWMEEPTPRLVVLWWVGLIAALALEALSLLMLEQAVGLRGIRFGHGVSLLANGLGAASASLGCVMVLRIGRAQQRRWERPGPSPGEAGA